LTARFEEIFRIDAGRDTTRFLSAADIHRLAGDPSASYWLVEGFSSGDRIAESAPTVLSPLLP
jgi:hypothetical protein